MHTLLTLSGMHCEGCARKIDRALREVPGVTEVRIDVPSGQVRLETSSAITNLELRQAVCKAGAFELIDGGQDASPARRAAAVSDTLPLLGVLACLAAFAILKNTPPAYSAGWLHAVMLDYMAAFFLLLGGLKIVNVRGFAAMFEKYDPIASVVPQWGYVYPFVEVWMGLAYLLRTGVQIANVLVVILLGVGLIGIWRTLREHRGVACACLGGWFTVPVTWLTFAENASMVAMAAYMLVDTSGQH